MRKAMLAGALALGMMGSSALVAQASDITSATGIVITNAQISQFKATLRLTAAQERYWAPVEAALRDMGNRQAQRVASGGFVQRLKAITLDAAGLRRLTSAAMPLLKSLDDDQKQSAMHVARAMGLAHVASAF
jgi:hypothetical protein